MWTKVHCPKKLHESLRKIHNSSNLSNIRFKTFILSNGVKSIVDLPPYNSLNMKFTNILFLLLVNTSFLMANNPAREARQNYIDQFSGAAMLEMDRSGVPASIILAQGIVESNSGNSKLALDSKNHFGIKCKDWTGRKVYYEDDDYVNGKLVKSCFRAYDNVLDSYADHSDFLLKGQRYRWLFDLERTDYEGWAKGLKKSGYATNPNYANMLINIIKDYNLYIYDTPKPQLFATNVPSGQSIDNNNIPAATPIAPYGQSVNNELLASNEVILETPSYQLNNARVSKPKRRKKLSLARAAKQVRAAQRPMYHGVNAR